MGKGNTVELSIFCDEWISDWRSSSALEETNREVVVVCEDVKENERATEGRDCRTESRKRRQKVPRGSSVLRKHKDSPFSVAE